ncbi:MAG: hypothetical protein AB1420_11190 [Bacillota bacterium]
MNELNSGGHVCGKSGNNGKTFAATDQDRIPGIWGINVWLSVDMWINPVDKDLLGAKICGKKVYIISYNGLSKTVII